MTQDEGLSLGFFLHKDIKIGYGQIVEMATGLTPGWIPDGSVHDKKGGAWENVMLHAAVGIPLFLVNSCSN